MPSVLTVTATIAASLAFSAASLPSRSKAEAVAGSAASIDSNADIRRAMANARGEFAARARLTAQPQASTASLRLFRR